MHKRIRLTVACLLALLLTGALALSAAAQGEGFSETFDNPELPGWERSPEVIVSGGVLRIAPANFAARFGSWRDFDLAVRLRCSGAGETHLNYHATDNGSYLLVLADEGATLLKTRPQAEPAELARANAPLDTGDWVDLRISLKGGSHSITLNGTPLLTTQDPDPLPAGTFAFASTDSRTTELDNIIVQIAAGQPPDVPSPPKAIPTATAAPPSTSTVWESLIDQLSGNRGNTLEWDAFVINLILAVVTSFILSRVYIYWGASLSNRRKLAGSFMLVTITTTFIILVVRSSVALSLGLVGALSIIRFRAAIKEPEELAYLFFAISLGIGLGDNQRLITVIALTVVIAVVGLARLLRQTQADTNLHLSITSRNPRKVSIEQVMAVLKEHCTRLRLLRYDENAEVLELSFVVEFEHISNLTTAQTALHGLSPDIEISFLDNKGVW